MNVFSIFSTRASCRFHFFFKNQLIEKQGYKKKILENAFVKFYRSHYDDEVWKYGASIKELREP